jgi:hypothetical protein
MMPLTIISWLKEVTPPRMRLGASSEMYIGETNEAVPTEMPSTKRAPISSGAVCEKAEARAPIT